MDNFYLATVLISSLALLFLITCVVVGTCRPGASSTNPYSLDSEEARERLLRIVDAYWADEKTYAQDSGEDFWNRPEGYLFTDLLYLRNRLQYADDTPEDHITRYEEDADHEYGNGY